VVVFVVRFVRLRLSAPLPSVGPYEITVRQSGFENVVRHLAVVLGAAFELPVPLSVSGIDTNVTVIADATVPEADRSQIAATVSEALLVPGCRALGGDLNVATKSGTNLLQ
jgi:hypothetical protein